MLVLLVQVSILLIFFDWYHQNKQNLFFYKKYDCDMLIEDGSRNLKDIFPYWFKLLFFSNSPDSIFRKTCKNFTSADIFLET